MGRVTKSFELIPSMFSPIASTVLIAVSECVWGGRVGWHLGVLRLWQRHRHARPRPQQLLHRDQAAVPRRECQRWQGAASPVVTDGLVQAGSHLQSGAGEALAGGRRG